MNKFVHKKYSCKKFADFDDFPVICAQYYFNEHHNFWQLISDKNCWFVKLLTGIYIVYMVMCVDMNFVDDDLVKLSGVLRQ